FLQLYETPRAVDAPDHVVRWLRRTTIHRSIDRLRRRQRRTEVPMDGLPEPSVRAPGGDPLLRQRLERLIGSLPEKPRAVLVLRYGEDMDVREIGRTLDMPVATVWSHLRRG